MNEHSVYQEVQAVYLRNHDGNVLYKSPVSGISAYSKPQCVIPALTGPAQTWRSDPDHSGAYLYACESVEEASKYIAGIVCLVPADCLIESAFRDAFLQGVAQKIRLSLALLPQTQWDEGKALASAITDVFEQRLRNVTANDLWFDRGRDYFQNQVRFFTDRNIPVEFCLPAFPCKSSNQLKVNGIDPDMGEQLAITQLNNFVADVRRVYRPGAKVLIISDGHVFSDCIGVDDTIVDHYGSQLVKLSREISRDLGSNPIYWFSLLDLLGLDSAESNLRTLDLEPYPLNHPVVTSVTAEAETARKVLMHGCQTRGGELRLGIEQKKEDVLALYRGFSRFMLEDLSLNPAVLSLSRNKRKKLASNVAFEMIRRNQAYSNLVEMVFPLHVRLSIHAHPNCGPKFGVRLLPADRCSSYTPLSTELSTQSEDLLHIPTPWHNCVFRFPGEGRDRWYVAKHATILAALASKQYIGYWAAAAPGLLGHYVLEDMTTKLPIHVQIDEVTDFLITPAVVRTA